MYGTREENVYFVADTIFDLFCTFLDWKKNLAGHSCKSRNGLQLLKGMLKHLRSEFNV
jgi:hypothetical protein